MLGDDGSVGRKRHLGFERLRLRGFTGANDEFLLAATAQNLKRLARRAAIPQPRFPKSTMNAMLERLKHDPPDRKLPRYHTEAEPYVRYSYKQTSTTPSSRSLSTVSD